MNLFKKIIANHILNYPTPVNLNYFWSFGSLAGVCLVIQMLTGIILAMHYTPHVDLAFNSIQYIMREVNYGWLIRYMHANGSSFFFIVTYLHMARGLYFKSYIQPRQHLWISGCILFLLMMATAFFGYILPWGQMSFWGATVITNLLTAIPYIGEPLVTWVWGGFSVDNATLNRFYSLHYLLPFIIAAMTFVHLALLHEAGSNNPLGLEPIDNIRFFPYFYLKDLFALLIFFCFYFFIIAYYPNSLGHPDNNIQANMLVTPAHIVPEWYFLPFYSILKSVPSKAGGVICMGLSIIILFFLPYLDQSLVLSPMFRIYSNYNFIIIASAMHWLSLGGKWPVTLVTGYIIKFWTVTYFTCFLILIPLLSYLENSIDNWRSIAQWNNNKNING